MEILRIRDLNFSYPDTEKRALSDVSLSVNEGEFVLICGSSGSGKTTLLKMLKNELAPSGKRSGDILFCGCDIETVSRRDSASRIGFVMQDPESQIVTDKVWHELAFGLENLGAPTEVIRTRVAETAGYFGLGTFFGANTDELSGGQKQLLNLAAVMTLRPDLLLLDEPTGRLDPIAASGFISTLKKLNEETGVTVILAEHRLEEVFPIADRVIVMEGGEIVCDEAPENTAAALKSSGRGQSVLPGLPTASRIYYELERDGAAPLCVKDGRDYLREKNIGVVIRKNEEKKPPTATVLEVKDVSFRYEKELPDVLKKLSVKAYEGEIFAILGGNGTGKTTMLNCISGLAKPYSGTVRILGKKIKEYKGNSLYRRTLAYLPQEPKSVFVKDTLSEDLVALCASLGMDAEKASVTVRRYAERFGIADLLERHPYDLSGGEQQKAALIKMLLSDPVVLLMDEPTKGLDAAAKNVLGEMISGLRDEGKTVLIVTHDVEFAAVFADRCALFFDGDVFAVEHPRKFFSGNYFYTTAACRISRGMISGAVTVEDVVESVRAQML